MNIHAMFPTLIVEETIGNHLPMNEMIINTLSKHVNDDGISHNYTGHVTLHHDPMYEEVFTSATLLAKKYCEVMQIDPSLFDFNIVKSWFNFLREGSNPSHCHADAHLSFSYYVNVPEEFKHPIRFFAHTEKYEPYPNFVRHNKPSEWNVFNSYAWDFPVFEGQMFMWPARMYHSTGGEQNIPDCGVKSIEEARGTRISIAGDILLIYKEKSSADLGLQPKRNWRTFSTGGPV